MHARMAAPVAGLVLMAVFLIISDRKLDWHGGGVVIGNWIGMGEGFKGRVVVVTAYSS